MDPYAMVAAAVIAVAGPAGTTIAFLFRRIDETNSQRLADQKAHAAEMTALHEQHTKEREDHFKQLASLHEQRLKEHDACEAKLTALHEQYFRQSKEMFDDLLTANQHLKSTVWTSANDLRELTEAIKTLTEHGDENARVLQQAIGQLGKS